MIYILIFFAAMGVLRPDISVASPDAMEWVSSMDSTVKIHPNPSNGPFDISGLGSWRGGTLRVFNSLGQEIGGIRISQDVHAVDLTGLPSGIYLMYLHKDGRKEVHRLVLK